MRSILVMALLLLSGCASPAEPPEDATEPLDSVAADNNQTLSYYVKAHSTDFMGVPGTLFMTNAPERSATVPSRIHALQAEGELLRGNVTFTYTSTGGTPGMLLRVVDGGTVLAEARGTGTLEMVLPDNTPPDAYLEIRPAPQQGVAGAMVQIQWTMELLSEWAV